MTEFWSKIGRKECLRYPYSPQKNCIFPKQDDVYQRNKSHFLASLISLGQKCLSDETSQTFPNERSHIVKWMRICENKATAEDLHDLLQLDEAAKTKASIIVGLKQLRQDAPSDWIQLRQLIFVHPVSQAKCAVFLVDHVTGEVQVFSVGECMTEELQAIGDHLVSTYACTMHNVRRLIR